MVKIAFLKAQQIKAGLDAGFIRREDYDKAVDAYMHALDFQLMGAMPSASQQGGSGGGSRPPQAPYMQQAQPTPAAAPAPAPSSGFAGPRHTVAGVGTTVQLLQSRNSSSSGAPADNGPLSNHTSVSEDGMSADVPADLPDYCKGATAGKVSGVGCREAGLACTQPQLLCSRCQGLPHASKLDRLQHPGDMEACVTVWCSSTNSSSVCCVVAMYFVPLQSWSASLHTPYCPHNAAGC